MSESAGKQVSIKKNYIMNTILTVSSFAFPLITFPYVSRVLLPLGTGKVSFAISLISYFNLFAQLGIPTYGVRACAQVRDDRLELSRVVQELILLNLIVSLFAYFLLALALLFVPRLQSERGLYALVSINILLSAIGAEWLYKGLELYSYITIRSLVVKLIAVILTFILIKSKDDYVIYAGLSIFASCFSNILNFLNLRNHIIIKPVGNYRFRRHLGAVGTFFLMACATTVYTNLDTVMLGFMRSDIDVGYYHAATRIKVILVGIVTSLGTVLLPRASYFIEHKLLVEFNDLCKKALNYVLLISIPIMLFFIMFAREGILLLSGKEYTGAILPMQILMPTLVFIGLTNILGLQMLVPLGMERRVLLSEIAGAITDISLNFVLIPKYGATGAAIGTLVAECVVLIVQIASVRHRFFVFINSNSYIKIVLAVVASAFFSIWVKLLNSGAFATLIISAGVFFISYFSFLLLIKEQQLYGLIKDLRSVLRIRNKKSQ